MRFEEILSSCIMCIVSGLVLVGFTIAWYTNNNLPAVTGMEMQAGEMVSVRVALETGGEDILELTGDQRYAEMGIQEFTNAESGELAPGVYGQVRFYITPEGSNVKACNIFPTLRITRDGTYWYPILEGDGEGSVSDVEMTTLQELYGIAETHISLYSDAAMEMPVTEEAPYQLTWSDGSTEEKVATIYWKWHYECPDSEEPDDIRQYDEEDMRLGYNVSGMKFYFEFSAQ